jgi:hypothetical protein
LDEGSHEGAEGTGVVDFSGVLEELVGVLGDLGESDFTVVEFL